ncbi:hypothetical protein [Streptomyces sp. CB03238]|uniref:hypothetical protein n=1 Tax=Streptomyces sp. CB03238 TaxID=1907777 RepID=UPI000A0FAE2E|nr:hypothetical protein [Streptomyces sp. CB03238]ORT58195.1 hypothetical protein BKD26_20035 [Streptomyces sp. CB03238]
MKPVLEYTKTVTERFNLGSYEHIEVTATVKSTDPRVLDDAIDELLARERQMAADLTTEDNSFAHVHPAITDDED